MLLADMNLKTLAITPLLLLLSSFFFHLRGAAFGSSKAFHCLLLLSCLLLSSVNTLHNLADYDSLGSNNIIAERFQSFNGGGSVAVQNVCPSSHLFSLLPALGSEYQFDHVVTFFRPPSCPGKSLLSNNNLSGVVWLSMKPVHIIEFQPFTGFSRIGGTKPLSKELFAKKNTRELSISVSGKQCGGLSIEPGEDSIKFLFFYQTEQLSCASGVAVFAVPMKSTAPVLMLSLCKKPVSSWWLRVKKLSVALLIAVALLILIFCFNDHFIEERNNIAVKKVAKPSTTITISLEMDTLLRSISKETLQGSSEVVSESSIKPVSASSSSQAEAVNLTVKTTKRRRNKKKKKKGAVLELTSERTDVSSSQSGNSTPRSPMSPKPPVVVTTQTPTKLTPKPVLSHAATFPVSVANKSVISSLAPNVRAPGAKKSRGEVEKEEEEYYRYDIWGDHLTGLHLMDRFKQVREGRSSCFAEEEESVSFFVKGPPLLHNLLTGSHAKPMGLIKK
ncbi:unnamed protein product [Eruca vesicaria subsp. sativa]|uniref:Transmembrane protein n=1 Tax=Eruca vesicaria subsp. sativa TaxID=29727 RepID=A0ABC8J788_ERUVS|nr:unnamed protein product [Eruca vesicaria subsp. sativa]